MRSENGTGREVALDAALQELPEVEREAWRGAIVGADLNGPEPAEEPLASDPPRKTQATRLVELVVESNIEFFHTPDEQEYATVRVNEHRETYKLRSSAFKKWLCGCYYGVEGRAVGAQAMQDALTTLEAKARFDGPEREVFTRIAAHEKAIHVDLCDPAWRAVEVTAQGWRVVADPPIRFRRAKGMLALPEPARGGDLDELRTFLNLGSDEDWRLLRDFLLYSITPGHPYPVLAVYGEQGSAKSTQTRVLKALIDPATAETRSEPREPRDLMIAAMNGQLLAFDNISRLPEWLSDGLCMLATGAGFSTRTLYSDDEETIFAAKRPLILNGITEFATRSDLLDRIVKLSLPRIPEEKRRLEADFWSDFKATHARLFGALLDALAGALRELPNVKLDGYPRMADFARFGVAVERALRDEPGSFISAYTGNRADANATALESSPIFEPLCALMEEQERWEGTVSELFTELELRADERTKRERVWPKAVKTLSQHLRRLAPNLRAVGIDVSPPTNNRSRQWHLTAIREVREKTLPNLPTFPAERETVQKREGCEAKREGSSSPENAGFERDGEGGKVREGISPTLSKKPPAANCDEEEEVSF